MARATVTLDYRELEGLADRMMAYGAGSGQIVDEVLREQGGPMINAAIMAILPVSGRKWRGKPLAARSTQPFLQENGMLSVTIRTKPAYHYLYFPDDGTDTRRHRGEQHFMERGAESVKHRILDLCVGALIDKFERG